MNITRENFKRLLDSNKNSMYCWQIEIVDGKYVISLKDDDDITYVTVDCSTNHVSKKIAYYILDDDSKKQIDSCIKL